MTNDVTEDKIRQTCKSLMNGIRLGLEFPQYKKLLASKDPLVIKNFRFK